MTQKEFFLFLLLFFINPPIAIVVMTMWGMRLEKNRKSTTSFLILFGIMCCVFVSLINMEIVTSKAVDLKRYVDSYLIAGKYDLATYLLVGPDKLVESYKEPLFYCIVWIMNRLFVGNEQLFKFSISLLEYSLFVSALIYLGLNIKLRLNVIMSGIVIMCFFPLIFTNSLNIIRQTLANAVLLYVMIRHFFYHKRQWLAIIAMPFIHTSAALFIPLLLMPGFGKPFKKSWIWFVGVTLLILFFQVLAQLMLGLDFLNKETPASAALERASAGALGDYNFSLFSFLVVLTIFIFSIFIFAGKLIPSTQELRRLMSVLIVLCIFVISNFQQDQLAIRFYHYVQSFIPIIFMILFQTKKVSNSFLFTFSLLTIIMFSIYLHIGYWTFDVTMGGWVTPLIGYAI